MSRTSQRQLLMKQQAESELRQPLTFASLPPFQLPGGNNSSNNSNTNTNTSINNNSINISNNNNNSNNIINSISSNNCQQQLTNQHHQQQQHHQPHQPAPHQFMPQSSHHGQVNGFESTNLDFVNQYCYGLDGNTNDAVASTVPNNLSYLCPSSSALTETPPPSLPNSNCFAVTSPKSSILSSSCPPGPTDATTWTKERQKKDNHNKIERRRRYNINDRIQELKTLLPLGMNKYSHLLPPNMKYNKGTILKASVDFMKEQQREVKILEEENAEKERQIEQLKRTLETVQQLLQTHRIESPIGSLLQGNGTDTAASLPFNAGNNGSHVNSNNDFNDHYMSLN